MTHTLLLLQHESCSPTRGGDGPSCVFGVLNLWEKTLIPTSVTLLPNRTPVKGPCMAISPNVYQPYPTEDAK